MANPLDRIAATIHRINGHWWNRRKRPEAPDLRAMLDYVSELRGALSWIETPFVDEATSPDELQKRVRLCVMDAARAAQRIEARSDETLQAARPEGREPGR